MTIKKSTCRMCHGGCGVNVLLENGVITEITGDKDNPTSHGFLCAKGKASIDLVYHPDRLRTPLKRIEKKGSCHFVPISWEDAFATIVTTLSEQIDNGHPESIVFSQGTDRNYQEWVFRLANAMGTPNVLGPAHICFYPRIMASIMTMGDFTFCDYENTPECIVLWGSNKAHCHSDGVIATGLFGAIKKGAEIVVIDPKKTPLTTKAKYWLQPKPGTDLALALGFLHLIVNEGVYDESFVNTYTSGFSDLREHVQRYTPRYVESITEIPQKLIVEVAKYYASCDSAAIEIGTGVEQNSNSFQCVRAIKILSGICGNIDRPGGDVIWKPTAVEGRRSFPNSDTLPKEKHALRLGGKQHPLLSMSGWAHPDAVWNAIVNQRPYPVNAMLVFGSNLLMLYANSQKIQAALTKLKFLVVADLYLTPTAKMADIVLPVSSWLERDEIVEASAYLSARQKCEQIGQCKSDEEIINELGNRIGQSNHFWPSIEAAHDYKLAPIGHTWRSFCQTQYIPNQLIHYKHEAQGFRTRNEKFNIYHHGLKNMGFSPLPEYHAQRSNEEDSEHYFVTTAHSKYFFNSEFRSIDSLRDAEPYPLLEMNDQVAETNNLQEGEWVCLRRGGNSIRLVTHINNSLKDNVIYAPASWWYPEDNSDNQWKRSNINILTDETNCNAEIGSSNLRGFKGTINKIMKNTEVNYE